MVNMKSSSSFGFCIYLLLTGVVTLVACQQNAARQQAGGQWERLGGNPSAMGSPSGTLPPASQQQTDSSGSIRNLNVELRELQRELRTLRNQVTDKERAVGSKVFQIVRAVSGLEQVNAELGLSVENKNAEIRRLKESINSSRNCATDTDPRHGSLTELHEDCKYPEDAGLCKGSFPRYFYDGRDGTCKEFVWGGCAGNPNNFVGLEECERKCGRG